MNLLIFLDLTYSPGKNFKFYSLQGQNFKIFLIFTYNQGKVFLILPITRGGGTCISGLHWELPPLDQYMKKQTKAIEYWSLYRTSTVQFLVVYKRSKK